MKFLESQLHRHARRLVALALLGALYLLAKLPRIAPAERQTLAARFRFEKATLPVVPGPEVRSVRPVHPSLRHIAAWISSVGAAVALNDLDGDGLSNDLCYLDVRTDQVIVAPVPGTGRRYEPFALDAGSLYNRETMAPMGCLPGDMNEDGRIDLLVYYWGRTPIAFLRTGASMSAASYHPVEIVPGGERWFTNAATFADLDGDGHADLIVGNYFEDGANILDAHGDGLEHMQRSMSRAFNGGSKRLMLWQGASAESVRYCDVPGVLASDVAHGWTLAIGAADLDGDLLPEIYFANDFGPDRLLHNLSTPGHLKFALLEGVRTLGVPKSKVLGRDSFKGMGVDFGDVNGDGWPDIFVSNIAAPYMLEESNFLWLSTGRVDLMKRGIAPYADHSEQLGVSRSGWGWDARLADFDNDGVLEALQAVGFVHGTVNRWPELHEVAMGNDELLSKAGDWHRFEPGDDLSGNQHNPFYVRASDGRYYDVAAEMGAGMAEPHVSRGIAIADVDGDGRLDYAVANQWEDSLFFHNTSPHPGTFLGLRIQWANGTPAIGAAATVELPDGRHISGQVDGGSGHSGKRSPEVHFGLGNVAADRPLAVEIRWRDGGGIESARYRLKPGWRTVKLEGRP
jgi:enediyne biosynthesis protein E4